MSIQTQRLYLRPFLPEDDVHLYAMYRNEKVIRYTKEHSFSSPKTARLFIENSNAHKKYGIEKWAVVRREDNLFLGWCGFTYITAENSVEIGYRFDPKFWGHGYATEAVRATLEYGFSTLKLPQIYAHSHKDNTASERVLTKCTMRFLKEGHYHDIPVKIYVKHNPYITISEISAKATYPVRHVVLRQGKPLASCAFEGDNLPTTLHFGAFFNDELMGVVTLLEQSHTKFPHEGQVQLRGMGVLPNFQKKGIGALLIKRSERELLKRNKRCIWMNARIIAVPFYTKLGYQTFGNAFTISDIGLHYVMVKHLTV